MVFPYTTSVLSKTNGKKLVLRMRPLPMYDAQDLCSQLIHTQCTKELAIPTNIPGIRLATF